MRSLALLSINFFLGFAIAGCAGNNLPIDGNSTTATSTNGGNGTNGSTNAGTNGSTNSGTNGTTNGGTTNSSTTNGGSTTNGTTNSGTNGTNGTTGGGAGSSCMSACDCATGLACFQNACTQAPMGLMLYCCDDSTDCPSGQVCQGSDGMFGQCGTNGGGTTGTNGGGTTGTTGTCKTACDCPTGEACLNGGCIAAPQGKLYCCSDTTNCPSGQFCQSDTGGFQMCGGGGNGGNNGGNNGGTTAGTGGTTGGLQCLTTKCMTDMDCKTAGCGACNTRRNTCRAM